MAPPRKLIVDIIGARNLMPKDGSGSASAFCTLDYDGNRRKTKTRPRDLNPSWGEKFDFLYGDGTGTLEINVYNDAERNLGGTRRHGFLGRVHVKVQDVVSKGQEALQWLHLDKRGLFSHVKGELALKVWYEDSKPPQPEPKENIKVKPAIHHPPEAPVDQGKIGITHTVTADQFNVRDVDSKNLGTAMEYQAHSFDLVEPMSYLYVKVVKARNLAAKDAGGTSDPYVKIAVADVHAKTQVVAKDLNPEWNRVFAFSKDKLHGLSLELSVWDADMVGADDFLGALSFLLDEIPTRKPPESPLAPQWYKLEERPMKARVKGEMMLALWMGTQADEAFQEAWQSDTGGHAHFRSKVYLSPKLWYLRVSVIEAQDLISPGDKNRVPEPYVEIQLGLVQVQRIIAPNVKGTNPVWNKDRVFVAAEPFEEALVLTVKDRVGGNKDDVIMGQTRIILSTIPRRYDGRQMPSSWFVLDSANKSVFSGRIHLRLLFDGGYHVLDESSDFSSCLRATHKQLWKSPLGVLELGVIGAKNLLPMHTGAGRGSTDAYCVAKYGQKWVRTRTITENFNPRWNEQYTWEVYDPCTVLTVAVFDNRHVQGGVASKAAGVKDVPIGKVRIRLSTLESDRVYTNAYPLLVVTASGIKKMGELECSVRFSCASTVNVMQAYLQPPLPQMHYYHPLDQSDTEALRIAAMNLVASRLARSEPPLRQEVVQFMLDTESHRWSMRRSKANYYRIATVLAGVFAVAKWFEDICKWKNPVTTVLVHILFLILLWYPELLLPTIFLYMFLIGAWNYRSRSRSPPFMDSVLSQGGEEPIRDLDELEEEFNVVTGNKAEAVLKARYERLRGFAGRIQNFLGTAATQGERLQALLSWRDPRATSIFVTFCLIAAVSLYVTPFRVVALLLGIYSLRHPKFRDPLPGVWMNFFRRLPSLSDRIL